MADARIFEDLKTDHDRHRSLLVKIADAAPRERAGLFEQFRVEVSAHAAAEEQSLYATMLGNPELQEDARHAVSEHKEIDDFLGELADGDAASDDWMARFAEMRHRYEHHIDEEEEDMFPAADAVLPDKVEAKLADKFENRKPAELEIAKQGPATDDRE